MQQRMARVSMFYSIFILFLIFLLTAFNFEVRQTKQDHVSQKYKRNQQLWNAIEKRSKERKEEPIDATIDRVWQAIPGYNGIELDKKKTYYASLDQWNKYKRITEIYRELRPLVQLNQLPAHPIYRGNPKKQMISIMINVAWGNEYIDEILHTLRTNGAISTFFLDGSWLKKNEQIAKKIKAAGHELSNHAYSHKNMSSLTKRETVEEIHKTELLLKKMGVANRLFAPPSGDYNKQTIEIARQFGLQVIMWSIDTVDWKKPNVNDVIRKVQRELHAGALILMHPTYAASKALPAILREAKRKKFKIGTVSELISSDRVSIKKGY